MSVEDLSTREKILFATIDCIEEEGIQSLTIRSIARRAGVNSAAINYYFSTKERLVDKALEHTMDEMADMPEEILNQENLNPRERLQAFFTALMDGMMRWPGIVKAHIYDPLMKNDYNTLFVRRFNSFLDDLWNRIKGMGMIETEEELKIAIIQIISAVVMPGLMPMLFHSFAKINFEHKETRKVYVTNLLHHFFYEYNKKE